jgi:hypothetical protein
MLYGTDRNLTTHVDELPRPVDHGRSSSARTDGRGAGYVAVD